MTDESIPRPSPDAVRERLLVECPEAIHELDHICPECLALGKERAFTTAAGLGGHRSRVHGVRGRRLGGVVAVAREKARWAAKRIKATFRKADNPTF